MRKNKASTPRTAAGQKKSRKTSTQEALADVKRSSTNNRDEVRQVTTHRQGHTK
jgi:hypothetical protein